MTGIHQVGAGSDDNLIEHADVGDCGIGIDLDAGNQLHVNGILFHTNTVDIDDEVGDAEWEDVRGEFPLTFDPDNFTGIAVNTGDGADTWTTPLVTVRAAAASPFKITVLNLEAVAAEKFRIRLTATEGSTYFSDVQFEGAANEQLAKAISSDPGSDFIFNKGAVIKAATKSESAGVDNCVVWLQIQEI